MQPCDNAKKNGKALHLMGLLSDGGVHSHNGHLYGLLEMAKRMGLDKGVCPLLSWTAATCRPTSGQDYVEELADKAGRAIGVGNIATVMGRYYAMDRDNRWDACGKGLCRHGVRRGRSWPNACGGGGKVLCRRGHG